MSRERFAWLEDWVTDPADVIATPGSESNVKEIYDKCAELSQDPANVIFNQFSEFGNYLVHYQCTGAALGDVFEHLREDEADLRLRAFVSASGSAGVPDHALQRVRRAQHPGHRRQAHTAHPQRLQH
jgi:cysteine synthase